ncbi:MAG: hypothetical protein QGI34_00550 [Candidatus Latescibacteria bacterium]|jgi:hypothetical protein|nr:hypothetical protein [Candidatus Latescibacterota bacterium]
MTSPFHPLLDLSRFDPLSRFVCYDVFDQDLLLNIARKTFATA